MARLLRTLTLAVVATATATAAVAATTVLTSSAETPLSAAPAPFGAHEQVEPSPLPVVRHVVVKPRAVPAAAAVKAAPTVHRTVVPTHRAVAPRPAPRRVVSTRLTPQQLLDRAVAALPNFHTGDAVFVLKPGLGSWGLTNMGAGIVYISPTVPADRMYSVVAHEWGHVLSAKPYKPDVMAGVNAMDAWFGASGMAGAERAADCIARLLGATWTNYTPCTNTHWRDGARKLLAGQPL
jgi:hypothetical protein